MIKTSRTIVFFGTEDFSLTVLSSLIDHGYSIAAVVTKPDSKRGRGQILAMPSVKKLAIKYNIPVWQPSKIADINNDIKSLGNDITGVLVSFGKLIPQSTINLFKPGIINVHPSLLPKYRGPSPIESAIENGDSQTGVSIMELSAEMDKGPVYGYIVHKLSGHETDKDLYKTLAQVGADKLIELLPKIIDGSIKPMPQNDSLATYCKLLNKEDSLLDQNKITAEQAERKVRAHLDFPKTKLTIFDHTIVITKAHVSNNKKTPLDIEFNNKKFLSIDELIAPSGRTMSARDFLNGYN